MAGEIGGGGVADFADNHQIFRLYADADADVELVFHRVKFGVVAAPIDIKFGIVGAFYQQAMEHTSSFSLLQEARTRWQWKSENSLTYRLKAV